jgi:hypothetical protein
MLEFEEKYGQFSKFPEISAKLKISAKRKKNMEKMWNC